MKIPFFLQKDAGRRGRTHALLIIERDAYSLTWTEADREVEIIAKTPADLFLATFPRPPTEDASRIYARHPSLRALLTVKLPEGALWQTVPARHLLAFPEHSSFWWGGNGLVDRTATVRVIKGWNPYAAGTRLPTHAFEAGKLLAPGKSLHLEWEETSVTPTGPQTIRCEAWLRNEDGEPRTLARHERSPRN